PGSPCELNPIEGPRNIGVRGVRDDRIDLISASGKHEQLPIVDREHDLVTALPHGAGDGRDEGILILGRGRLVYTSYRPRGGGNAHIRVTGETNLPTARRQSSHPRQRAAVDAVFNDERTHRIFSTSRRRSLRREPPM